MHPGQYPPEYPGAPQPPSGWPQQPSVYPGQPGPSGAAQPNPAQAPYPTAPLAEQQVPPYGYGPYPPQRSGGGKKAALIVLVVVVTLGLLAAGGFGAYALLSDDDKSPASPRSDAGSEYAKLGDPGNLSNKDLDKVNSRKLFLETVRNMMLQTKVRTKSETMTSDKKDLSDGFGYNTDIRFDYQTKALSFERESGLSENRCIDGKSYLTLFDKTWQEARFGGCELRKSLYNIGDGVNIFGLTKAQADKVLAYFTDDFPDLIQVEELELKSGPGKENKKYLRFVVDYVPIPSAQYGYLGLQHFVWAFKRADIEFFQHPYSPKGSGGQGLHVVYYVDPTTGLPVYSQQSNIPPFDKDGKPRSLEEAGTSYREDRYEYYFEEKFPTFDMSTNDKITLKWERDKDDAEWKPQTKQDN